GLVLVLGLSFAALLYGADQPGTVGVGLVQLYSEQQPNHRGPLVVVQVEEGLPGAEAGVQRGDIVVAVNGVPVPGREITDIVRNDVHGSVGSGVRLTIVRPPTGQFEVSLRRVPYAPHKNPVSDPFSYSIPGQWSVDPRYSFPLPWSPALNHRG